MYGGISLFSCAALAVVYGLSSRWWMKELVGLLALVTFFGVKTISILFLFVAVPWHGLRCILLWRLLVIPTYFLVWLDA